MKGGKEMKVENRLFVLMAERGIKNLTTLADEAQVKYRSLVVFANQEARFLDPELIAKICKTLDCQINELLVIKK
jgi:DNA-binding Xre family transcriptional regulator